MRICHVITRLIIGGAQENTILTCEGLCRRGHEVTLIAGPETGPEGSLWEAAEQSGAKLIKLDSLVRTPSPAKDLRCLAELGRIFRRESCDMIHTHSSKAGILGRKAAASVGESRVVHTIHGMSFNRTQWGPTQWFYRTLERFAAKHTDAFVTVADAIIKQAVAAGLGPREKFTTVYSGMETDRYVIDAAKRSAVRAEWGVNNDHVVVGTVARLFRNKGYDELIEAMAPAVANAPMLQFVWIGDGAQRDEYVERVRKRGLADRLHLTGLVSPKEVPELVGGFDVLVHASRWEGLPRAVVQGLLMGAPGVSFDIDGAPEVIEDGVTGRLVPMGDTVGLAAAIVELAKSPEKRKSMGAEGRRRCLERFDVGAMVEALERLYRGLGG